MIRSLYKFCLKLNESETQDVSTVHLGHDIPQELSEVSIFLLSSPSTKSQSNS